MELPPLPAQIQKDEAIISGSVAKFPWDQFSEWLSCVIVVTFDLELGQAIEFIYPNHTELSPTEQANICYLAFPDSNSGCMGDTQYCFRIRKTKLPSRHNKSDHRCTKDCPVTLLEDKTHYYGYVYFRQVRDKTLERGYFQKSVVLLSSLPYFNFFKKLVEIVAPEYFNNGEAYLEAACHNIDQWPCPVPGKTLSLPLTGVLVHIRIPSKQDKPGGELLDYSNDNEYSLVPSVTSSIHEVDLHDGLCQVISHIHLLWELVLLGEPLVVMAPSPTSCASTVLALVSCITPLRYRGDFRPYFTIHDSEFKEFTSQPEDPPGVILGVTNPFFEKTFRDWPHVVRVGKPGPENFNFISSLFSNDFKVKNASKLKPFDHEPGVYTKYKPFLKKDSKFLKAFAKSLSLRSNEKARLIKRHFVELTESFVIPLERYLASLMPLQKSISPFKPPPSLKPFRVHDFLQTVENNGPQLTSATKGDWIGLYERFLHTANCSYWMRRRRKEMKAKILSLYLIGFCDVDLTNWCCGKEEVEIVDMLLKLRRNINLVSKRRLDVPCDAVERLNAQMKTIVASVSDDLQDILKKEFL